MNSQKQLDIQRQIRNNNEDFQSYARELKLWETEMKRKDNELTQQSNQKDVPPIRKKCKKEEGSLSEAKPQRISAYDYSSWDKFDVDKACEEMDHENSDEDSDTDVEEEDLDKIATAVYYKEQGNKLVKEGKWGEAIEKYNRAIETYPHDAVFYANRALCFLKMKNFISAEADCSSSLNLDNSYVKAYLRRASARQALNQFQAARNDLLKIIALEPNNKQAEIELGELNRKLSIENTQTNLSSNTKNSKTSENKMSSSSPAEGSVTKCSKPPDLSWIPVYDTSEYSVLPGHIIPPYQRSKTPLIKVNIEPDDISPIYSVETNCTSLIKEKARKIQIVDDKVQEKSVINDKEEDEKVDVKSNSEERKKKFEMLESAWNELQNANPYQNKVVDAKQTINQEPSVECKTLDKPQTTIIPAPAKTCSQFELHWRTLKTSEENLYLYLKQIKGGDLPSIFKEGLQPSTFIDIVKCLGGKFLENNDCIGEYIQGLSKTPRLASLIMFLSKTEKSLLCKLVQYCEENNELSSEDLKQLSHTFEL